MLIAIFGVKSPAIWPATIAWPSPKITPINTIAFIMVISALPALFPLPSIVKDICIGSTIIPIIIPTKPTINVPTNCAMQLIMPAINPKAINIIINSRATPLLGNNPVTSVAVAVFTSVLIRELAAVFDTVDATPLIALIAFQPVLLLDEKGGNTLLRMQQLPSIL